MTYLYSTYVSVSRTKESNGQKYAAAVVPIELQTHLAPNDALRMAHHV